MKIHLGSGEIDTAENLSIRTSSSEQTVTKEVIDAHVLEPGDLCWLLNSDADDPLAVEPVGWGVVLKSDANGDRFVEAKIGADPCRLYARKYLRWMGP